MAETLEGLIGKIIDECERSAGGACYDCFMADGACHSHGPILAWANNARSLLAEQPEATAWKRPGEWRCRCGQWVPDSMGMHPGECPMEGVNA